MICWRKNKEATMLHQSERYAIRMDVEGETFRIYDLTGPERDGFGQLSGLPYVLRILLEDMLRHFDGSQVTEAHIRALAGWNGRSDAVIPFLPARVLLQDFTGVPAVVDLAAMRTSLEEAGGDPGKVNPVIPVDLVVDHSVTVDCHGTPDALACNIRHEFERNAERYQFLRWAQGAFNRLRIFPPSVGICHQVNLECLATVVTEQTGDDTPLLHPDTLVGTDSHTPMVNGIGVLGWGVGGIEAEACMLGLPLEMPLPEVVGVELTGRLSGTATATDLALTVTELLRKAGVVGCLVEYYGEGLAGITVEDRATVANMAPEYGATTGFFPVDDATLDYLKATGRPQRHIALVEAYCRRQGLFRLADAPVPLYSRTLHLDLGTVVPSLAGPRRPQDRVALGGLPTALRKAVPEKKEDLSLQYADGHTEILRAGAVVLAAITSCTNTSNPHAMLLAGLVARKAAALELKTPRHVKTSLAPGSLAVTRYLEEAGLLEPLQALGFHVAGYGCTTCIGNSGPLVPEVAHALRAADLPVSAVLSGNRNFEGRIHPQIRLNWLASPALVVAFALAGTVDVDMNTDPIATASDGRPVYLADLWPDATEVAEAARCSLSADLYRDAYQDILTANNTWNALPASTAARYAWDPDSTYIRRPPFFEPRPVTDAPMPSPVTLPVPVLNDTCRILALLGDSVTTDHISPAGSIPQDTPAGRYLLSKGVGKEDFNSYGSRRGNHEVMMRGTFANIRIRNRLTPEKEGGWTRHWPDGALMPIFDACQRYQAEHVPLIVVAGSEYGTGSSRDWAAKGTALLGVTMVLARGYERIHRSNLVGMGVLPLQFLVGESPESWGLTGTESITLASKPDTFRPMGTVSLQVRNEEGTDTLHEVLLRLDSQSDIRIWQNGGILRSVLQDFSG
jgi:aconitate hydratase